MMSRKNRYPGINPHLNSYLQHVKGWKGFHTLHIGDIARLLDARLPEGYYTGTEESLQINTYDRDDLQRKSTVYPDVTIYGQHRDFSSGISVESGSSTPTLIMPVLEEVEDEEFISSIVIFRDEKPITRIELLSPANKHPGSDAEKYQSKREQALYSGLCLVEIDYLHGRHPVDGRIPSYRDKAVGATPYSIIISDPRPNPEIGLMKVYGFGVLDALPIIDIPLDAQDSVQFDFGNAYQQTFESSRIFYDVRTNYALEPVNFEIYSPQDQEKIRQQMTLIAQHP